MEVNRTEKGLFYPVRKLKKKLPPLIHILVLKHWVRKALFLEPFEIPNFDLGHPVVLLQFQHERFGQL